MNPVHLVFKKPSGIGVICSGGVALLLLITGEGLAGEIRPWNGRHWVKQEIDTQLGIGYAVLPVDINGDGKLDLVVVDQQRVVWYENPTWRRRIIIERQTRPDNVCIAAYDIDGDGQVDLALGADWRPFDTRSGGTLQWLRRGQSLEEPWQVFPIDEEPTIHRIRFVDLDGDGRPELVVAPLMGRGATARGNWLDGQPVRILAYRIPEDPVHQRWPREVLDQSLHVVHNFWAIPAASGKGAQLLLASYEGVSLLARGADGRWQRQLLGQGNQEHPQGRRGASEVKQGRLGKGRHFLATIEPWHGHQVVVYTAPAAPGSLWQRQVLDDHLRWGHAVWCADLDGDGRDEVIVGVRDDPEPGAPFSERRGVRLYHADDAQGQRWSRQIVERGGLAVEDLVAVDLDGDGWIDLVAVGRQTHNLCIYWNRGPGK
jgi:hypothetical protein